MKKLRIAQVGTIWETTPPPLYGGTERVVYCLTEELVRRGHDITLFATGDSKTSGKLESIYPRALYRDGIPWSNPLYPLLHITNAFDRANEFDIIHMHLNTRQDYVSLAFAKYIKTPLVITIHFVLPKENDLAKQDRLLLLKKYKDNNFVAISNAQRTLGFLNYAGTVYNGLDFSEFKLNPKPENYLAWFGGIRHDKGTAEAIAVAKKTGMKLVIAGKVDWANEEYKKYYKEKIEPEIDGKQITYIGELGDKEKIAFLGKAKALLHPLNWNEPFGLVAIEAMACGTPVIAFDNGPVREQIIEGKTGFIVKNIDEMAEAVGKIDSTDRAFCKKHAEEKFSAKAMAEGYEAVYRKVIAAKNK